MNEPNERLSELLNDLRDEDIDEIADASYVFDNEDPYQTASVWINAVGVGLDLALKFAEQGLAFDQERIQVVYNAEGDTVFLFIGTEDEVAAKIRALESSVADAIEASNDADRRQDEEDDEDEDAPQAATTDEEKRQYWEGLGRAADD